MSGEKKRLEQFLLQSRASNIINVAPEGARFVRFQPEQIDTIRLRSAQIEAGKKPVSEKVIKQQQKKKKKARRGKQLRGEVSRAIREQKRFERGERRDKPEEEPRIIGEPRNTGLSYDPDIERRRLDIQEQQIRDANIRALGDRRAASIRQEQELAVRRGELAAGRAERRLERERLAAAAPPPPIVIPPAPAPDIRVEGARIEGPLVTGPLLADPIPEITRLGQQIRGDYDAFGEETRARNEDFLRQVREQTEAQQAQAADVRQRQLETDQVIREAVLRQDAINQDIQDRLGLGEVAMTEARDSVIREIRDAEDRLRQATRELDRPTSYDDVLLRAAADSSERQRLTELPEVTPSPSLARPSTPVTPELAASPPGAQAEQAEEELELTLSPEDPRDRPGAVVEGINPETGQPFRIQRLPGTAGPTGRRAGGGGALRLETEETRAQRAARTTPVREQLIESPVATPDVPVETPSTPAEEAVLEELRVIDEPLQPVAAGIAQFGGARPGATERVIEDAGIQEQRNLRPLDPDVLFEEVAEAEQVGVVQDQSAQRIRDSQTTFQDSLPELSSQVRTGPRGRRGQRGGLGYRVRNNTDRILKRIEPGDVVNVIGVEEGERGEGRYRLDTQTQTGTRVSLDEFGPLVDDGSFIFERGHRHELGGHFDENPYGPLTASEPTQGAASQVEQEEEEEELTQESEPEP